MQKQKYSFDHLYFSPELHLLKYIYKEKIAYTFMHNLKYMSCTLRYGMSEVSIQRYNFALYDCVIKYFVFAYELVN